MRHHDNLGNQSINPQINSQTDQERNGETNNADPHIYNSYTEYLFTLIGYTTGFGSFWRFPYLLYKNGGGVFLIPFLVGLILIAVPMNYLEVIVGQTQLKSIPFIFKAVNPALKMIGVSIAICLFFQVGVYNLLQTYTIRYIFSAFLTPNPFENEDINQSTYFQKTVLNKSDSMEEFGSINWVLLIIYLFSMLLCFFVVKNGVKTSGPVIVFTASIPYVFLFILFIRGITLEGSLNGIKDLLSPKFEKLFTVSIWTDAIVQALYQIGIGCGGHFNFASMKTKSERVILGIYVLPVSVIVCSLLCTFTIYSFLGHYCLVNSMDFEDLTLEGAQLSYSVFPKILATLPWPSLWLFIFFVSLTFLSIDTIFTYLQSIFCNLKDEFLDSQRLEVCGRVRLTYLQCQVCTMVVILVPVMLYVSSAGIYYLKWVDSLSIVFSLPTFLFLELIFFVHCFSFSESKRKIFEFTSQKAPAWIQFILTSKFFLALTGLLVLFSTVQVGRICRTYSPFYAIVGGLIAFGPLVFAASYLVYYQYFKPDKSWYQRRWNRSFKEIAEVQKEEQIQRRQYTILCEDDSP